MVGSCEEQSRPRLTCHLQRCVELAREASSGRLTLRSLLVHADGRGCSGRNRTQPATPPPSRVRNRPLGSGVPDASRAGGSDVYTSGNTARCVPLRMAWSDWAVSLCQLLRAAARWQGELGVSPAGSGHCPSAACAGCAGYRPGAPPTDGIFELRQHRMLTLALRRERRQNGNRLHA